MGRHDSRARARELLAEFDLSDAGGRLVRTYSGGMRRRLDLAAALVARPPVLFLDEPTTGLDPRSRLALWDTIESLVSGGSTVLLTTQYLDEAERLADRIVVIDHGRVIAEGTSSELKEKVGSDRLEVRLADGAAGERRARGARRAGVCARRFRTRPCACRSRERKGAIADAVRRLDEAGVAIDDIAILSPTLDDVFLQLTGHGAEERRRRPREQRSRTRSPTRSSWRSGACSASRASPTCWSASPSSRSCSCCSSCTCSAARSQTPGFDYVDFLMPGIIVQSMAFGGFVTALGLSEDLKKGLMDRFRSLPMSRSAVLTGRTLADVGTNVVQLVVMLAVGLAGRLPLLDQRRRR